jgi:hypothetical protein
VNPQPKAVRSRVKRERPDHLSMTAARPGRLQDASSRTLACPGRHPEVALEGHCSPLGRAVSERTGLGTVDRRHCRDVPGAVADAEGPRTQVGSPGGPLASWVLVQVSATESDSSFCCDLHTSGLQTTLVSRRVNALAVLGSGVRAPSAPPTFQIHRREASGDRTAACLVAFLPAAPTSCRRLTEGESRG